MCGARLALCALASQFFQKPLVDAGILRELGMERGHHVPALLHPNRIALVGRQNFSAGADSQDLRRAYENRLHLIRTYLKPRDLAINLAAVGVALDVDIDEIEAGLRGFSDGVSQQDRAGASSEDRLMSGELP